MHSRRERILAYLPAIVLGVLLGFFILPATAVLAYEQTESSECCTFVPEPAPAPEVYTHTEAPDCCAFVPEPEPVPEAYIQTESPECCTFVPEPTPAPEVYIHTEAPDCCVFVPEPTPAPEVYIHTEAPDCCVFVPEPTPEVYIHTEAPDCCTFVTPSAPEPPEEPPFCLAFTASDYQVRAGDFVTLTWDTLRAETVSINNGIGIVPDDGSRLVQINFDVTYILSVSNTDGFDTCQLTIIVEDDVPLPPGSASCDAFTVSDTRVNEGDFVTLTWLTTNAQNVIINNGIGSVAGDGNMSVRIWNDITYVLTAQNVSGTDTCQVTIIVDEDNNSNPSSGRCDSLTASDYRVNEGDYITLRWRTTNADDVRINNGIGDVSDDGERRVRIRDDITYILTVRDGNNTDTCRVSIEVEEEDDNDDLRCRALTISDRTITAGGKVTLRWSTEGADRAVLRDNHGREYFDTREDREYDEDSGSIEVRPTRSTIYTLSIYDGNDRETCSEEVDMEDAIASFRFQGGIPLARVPYTGFEPDSAFTVIFATAALLWAIVTAYFLLRRERGFENKEKEFFSQTI